MYLRGYMVIDLIFLVACLLLGRYTGSDVWGYMAATCWGMLVTDFSFWRGWFICK